MFSLKLFLASTVLFGLQVNTESGSDLFLKSHQRAAKQCWYLAHLHYAQYVDSVINQPNPNFMLIDMLRRFLNLRATHYMPKTSKSSSNKPSILSLPSKETMLNYSGPRYNISMYDDWTWHAFYDGCEKVRRVRLDNILAALTFDHTSPLGIVDALTNLHKKSTKCIDTRPPSIILLEIIDLLADIRPAKAMEALEKAYPRLHHKEKQISKYSTNSALQSNTPQHKISTKSFLNTPVAEKFDPSVCERLIPKEKPSEFYRISVKVYLAKGDKIKALEYLKKGLEAYPSELKAFEEVQNGFKSISTGETTVLGINPYSASLPISLSLDVKKAISSTKGIVSSSKKDTSLITRCAKLKVPERLHIKDAINKLDEWRKDCIADMIANSDSKVIGAENNFVYIFANSIKAKPSDRDALLQINQYTKVAMEIYFKLNMYSLMRQVFLGCSLYYSDSKITERYRFLVDKAKASARTLMRSGSKIFTKPNKTVMRLATRFERK